jgi:Phytanoyl-CoA dioxygenase (PhyH)
MDVAMTLDRDGFVLLRGAFSAAECDLLLAQWTAACATEGDGLMRSATGTVYGARNILSRWPGVVQVVRQPKLFDALQTLLGSEFGLARVLFFDKPPGESWALPWHKDLAIAVKDNGLRSTEFKRPTTKYGVPHVEGPTWLLERMLTARLHLDDVTNENGPLKVLPGSHCGGKAGAGTGHEVRILCERGDVLLMRPLLSHCSGHSNDSTMRHRRVLHLEFSPIRELPDGFEWHTFIPPTTIAVSAAGRSADQIAAPPSR